MSPESIGGHLRVLAELKVKNADPKSWAKTVLQSAEDCLSRHSLILQKYQLDCRTVTASDSGTIVAAMFTAGKVIIHYLYFHYTYPSRFMPFLQLEPYSIF